MFRGFYEDGLVPVTTYWCLRGVQEYRYYYRDTYWDYIRILVGIHSPTPLSTSKFTFSLNYHIPADIRISPIPKSYSGSLPFASISLVIWPRKTIYPYIPIISLKPRNPLTLIPKSCKGLCHIPMMLRWAFFFNICALPVAAGVFWRQHVPLGSMAIPGKDK